MTATADILLSLAKDDRYVSEVVSLLSQAIVPFASIFFPTRRNNCITDRTLNNNSRNRDFNTEETLEDDGRQFIDRIRPELNFLASILVHSATFVFYSRNFGLEDEANYVDARRSIGMESLNLTYRFPQRKIYSTTSPQNSSILRRIKELLVSSTKLFQISAWHRLLFLQTVVPYIINRVGRGGWSQDLDGLIFTFLQTCGLRRINDTATDRSTIQEASESGDAFRNDDMLRGSARRRLFLEQRRRMMSSSTDNQRSSLFSSDDSEDNRALNHIMQPNQVQRSSRSIGERNGDTDNRRWKQISKLSWEVTLRISNALSSLSHGAHQLPRHIGPIESQDKYTKIIRWLLRLHLALFYWNGIYPSITHRIAGAKLTQNAAVVANRPSYKPVAALIFMQAASALLQATASVSIDLAHKIQIAFFRWHRRGIALEQRGSISFNQSESERSDYLQMIEARVPGIDSSPKDSTKSFPKNKGRTKMKNDSDSHHPCGICLNERIHPAASSKCGHVFCWNCILHWVLNVKEECPLCRASTSPQDVVPLYNYS